MTNYKNKILSLFTRRSLLRANIKCGVEDGSVPRRKGEDLEDTVVTEADSEVSGVAAEYDWISQKHGLQGRKWLKVMGGGKHKGERKGHILLAFSDWIHLHRAHTGYRIVG